MYKWLPVNLILEVTLRWTSIPPGGGGKELFLVALCYKAEVRSSLMGHLTYHILTYFNLFKKFVCLFVFNFREHEKEKARQEDLIADFQIQLPRGGHEQPGL